jgi:DNA modification methylase
MARAGGVVRPYYSDDSVTLWHGDALAVLRGLPDASVDCCVTSPPYFGLRDYGVEGQQGLESSPAAHQALAEHRADIVRTGVRG